MQKKTEKHQDKKKAGSITAYMLAAARTSLVSTVTLQQFRLGQSADSRLVMGSHPRYNVSNTALNLVINLSSLITAEASNMLHFHICFAAHGPFLHNLNPAMALAAELKRHNLREVNFSVLVSSVFSVRSVHLQLAVLFQLLWLQVYFTN